jgi:hypothetical protein
MRPLSEARGRLRQPPDRNRTDTGLSVVSFHRRCVVIGRAQQAHQTASFGDGDTMGPVMTDVIALLVRVRAVGHPLTPLAKAPGQA